MTRSRLGIMAIVVAGVAFLATSPVPTAEVSKRVDQQLTLSPDDPTLVRHVTARIDPGDPDTALALVFIDWPDGRAKPIDLTVSRGVDGAVIDLDPLPAASQPGHYGGSFAPFLACESGKGCEAVFTVTFQLVATEQALTQWSFVISQPAKDPQAASNTSVELTIEP